MNRPSVTHIILIDGTFASLLHGRHSNIGRIYRLLRQARSDSLIRLHYSAGQQWEAWRTLPDLAMGHGLALRITNAYGWLASRYQPGDKIVLLGYSRGAFAVRSLAGMIDKVGLLQSKNATERKLRLAWRFYREGGTDRARALFRQRLCHDIVPIDFLGVFDTVMALGIRVPGLWMLTEPRFRFHEQHLGAEVRQGVQALALDETRAAFQPILWKSDGQPGVINQTWFRGCHADIGGQLNGAEISRPLANIPLVWMLQQMQEAGIDLPRSWHHALFCDVNAPSIGSWRGWGKAFLARAPRIVGRDISEQVHSSVPKPYSGPAIFTGQLAGLAAHPKRFRRGGVGRPAKDL